MLLFRIKFYTQEIVFFRQDLLYRMRRSCLLPPSTEETSDPFEHVSSFSSLHLQACFTKHPTRILMYPLFLLQLVATIVHQSHLCPLPLNVQPIIWNYDHCLQLYPSPQTVQTYTSKCNLFSTVLTSFREARLFYKKIPLGIGNEQVNSVVSKVGWITHSFSLQIVLGDQSEQKAFKYAGITCFNPGSFSNESTFVAYRPCRQEVELSAL